MVDLILMASFWIRRLIWRDLSDQIFWASTPGFWGCPKIFFDWLSCWLMLSLLTLVVPSSE